MLFNGGGGRDLEGLGMVLITSNPSFLILPSWRDLEGVQNIEMLDQMNYQIYPYHINKITNYEKTNYSPLPYLILKYSNKMEDNYFLLLSSPLLSFSLLSSSSQLPNIALGCNNSLFNFNGYAFVILGSQLAYCRSDCLFQRKFIISPPLFFGLAERLRSVLHV